MTYRPVLFAGFGGGLNLRDQPDVVDPAQAIDILNVTLTEKGALKLRDGFDNHTSSELTNRGWTVYPFYKSDGTNQLLVGCDTRLEAIATGGTVVASATGLTTSTRPWRFVRFGGPSLEAAFAGNGQNSCYRWNGAAWTTGVGLATVNGSTGANYNMPKAGLLAVMPNTNRLVAAGFEGTADGPAAAGVGAVTNPSYVYFSDQGAPTTWQTTSNPPTTYNNSLQFTPGDGERITAMVSWREFVFVFKESKFFVIYGESTAANGGPVFNYRTVDAGVGCVGANAVCVGRDGVYFLDRTGVYRTAGGPPEQVSDLIDPFFTGRISAYYQGGVFNHAQAALASLCWHEEKLYASVPVGAGTANSRVLVFDPRYGWWSLYDIPAAGLCSWKPGGGQPALFFSYASGSKHIGKHSSAYTTDDGTAIDARWQSGWFDFGDPDVKALRELKLWGSGGLYVGMAVDYQAGATLDAVSLPAADTWGDGTGSDTWGDGTGTDTWGSGAATTSALVRRAHRGTVFSVLAADNAGAAFEVLRMTHHIREGRVPSVKTG